MLPSAGEMDFIVASAPLPALRTRSA